MALRKLKLPDDFIPLGDMLAETFQYPENESWSVQTDEQEQIQESVQNFKRIWPLIRFIQCISPPARDLMRGFVWEEDGQLVGTTTIQRRGATDVWIVGTVGVLPSCRRRGIARKLVEASLDLIKELGGKKAFLGVIDGNLPAYQLYESLGFENYSGSIEFHIILETAPSEYTLPEGYILTPLKRFEWQMRYELEKRISPESLLKYEPVEVGRFRMPLLMRLIWPLIMFAQGMRVRNFAIYTAPEDKIVARFGYTTPTRGKGLNTLEIRLDPDHPELAPFIIHDLMHRVMSLSPGRRIEISVPKWMPAVISAVEAAGFEHRLEQCYMGVVL
jgi:ribosomal protein S18 acetylase RimI-like enzyme